MLTRKDFETFLTNEVVITATKSSPFDFQTIINQIALNYGSLPKDKEPIVQAFLAAWQVPDGWLLLETFTLWLLIAKNYIYHSGRRQEYCQ